MPDVVLQNYPLTPNTSNGGQLPQTKSVSVPTNPNSGVDLLSQGIAKAGQLQRANAKNSIIQNPFVSPLSGALRYTDPNIGFNPLDSKLEFKYADAHPFKTFGNNLLQSGARFLGAAAEAIATIPLAIDAVVNKDFSKLYNNDFTNTITDWLDGLNTSLPVYTTEYEQNHPVRKYLNFLRPTSFFGALGGAVNNLGYTAGAIAGAIVEDTVITALTGGAGLLPAAAGNARQLFKAFTKTGKLAAEAPNEVRALMRATELTGTEGGALIRAEGAGLYQNAGRTDQLLNGLNPREQILNNANRLYKIRDAVKYNLALLTSATAEGAFEAADVYHRGKKELEQQFFDIYGRSPVGKELETIHNQAKGASNFTMGMNIALLALSNHINWGSLFKPTSQAFKEGITGFGKNVARSNVKSVFNEAEGKIAYELISKTPESRIGRMLLSAEKAIKISGRPLNESLEEASQFMISEGSLDYVKRKYDPNNLKQVGDLAKSFSEATNKTFTTNEGWDNIVGGYIGGILGGGLTRVLKLEQGTSLKDQLNNQIQILNGTSFNGALENRIQEIAVGTGLATEHKQAVESGNTYKAKNLKFDMLYNWVATGVRANSYERRIEELNMVRDLTGKSFEAYWGVVDTEQNRQGINNFLDGVIKKAENIKANVEKVEYLAKNPHKAGTLDHTAYENYKESLSLNLSRYNEYQNRVNEMKQDLHKIAPLLNINDAIHMTSVQGIHITLKKINSVTDKINKLLIESEGNTELHKDLKVKKQALDSIYSRLQSIVYSGVSDENGRTENVDFKGNDFVSAMHDLFNLYNGLDIENNNYVESYKQNTDPNIIIIEPKKATDDDLADALEKLQDIYKLSNANYNIGKYYTYLRKGLGETEYTTKFKNMILNHAKVLDENGEIQTPESVEDKIRQEEYFDTDPGETTAEERVILKQAAKKAVHKEPLSTEEQAAADKHEAVFTSYVRNEQNIKTKTETGFKQEYDDIFNPDPSKAKKTKEPVEQPKTESTKEFNGLTPDHLFFALHRNPFFGDDLLKNLHKLIFNTPIKEIGRNFNALITKRPDGERNITPVSNKGKLFRSDFEEVIQINNGKGVIGELRPPDSIFLDTAGTQSIFTADGKLNITEDEFTAITGNSIDQYAKFKEGAEGYYKSYFALKHDIALGHANAATIAKHFIYGINVGTTIFNPPRYKEADTLLKNTKPKDKVVLKLNKVITDNSVAYTIQILDDFGAITANTRENIKKVVAENPEHFTQYEDAILVAFPVGEKVGTQSFVRGRLNDDRKTDYANNLRLVTKPEVFENYTINFRPRLGKVAEAPAPQANKEEVKPPVQEQSSTEVPVVPNNVTVGEPIITEPTGDEGTMTYTFNIKNNDVEVGKIVLDTVGDDLHVVSAEITPAKQGIGFEAYKQIAKWAADAGFGFKSEAKQSPAAIALWDKLVRAGLAFKIGDVYTYGQLISEEQAPLIPIVEHPVHVTYSENKTKLAALITKYFGISVTQARATAELFDRMAQAWAERTGNEAKNYYKTIGFATKEEFNQLINTDNLLNQIIGAQGAARLDNAATIMANLDVAKQMQAAFKTRSEVRHATGWELMGDGKWRYEIDDNLIYNEKEFKKLKSHEIVKLGELIKGSPLLEIYPELAKIEVERIIGYNSHYNKRGDKISISSASFGSFRQKFTEVLVHEIQHAIQAIEGFTTGGNDYTISEVFDKFGNDYKDKIAFLDALKDKIDNSAVKTTLIEKAQEELMEFKQNYEMGLATGDSFLYGDYPNLGHVAYTLLAGEVEARNASKRLNYTDAERLQYTLNSTEDIDEESKIYLQGQVDEQNQANPITKIVNSEKWGLKPKYENSLFVGYTTKNGKATKELAIRINQWLTKEANIQGVNIIWDATHGTIVFRERNVLFQEARGAFDTVTNIIYALTNPDVTTLPHELAHAWEQTLTAEERKTILDWAGHTEWSRDTSEKFAKGFELYLAEGNITNDAKLNSIFEKFAKWLANVYANIKEVLGIELNNAMRDIYSKMLNSDFVETTVKETIKQTNNLAATDDIVEQSPSYNIDYQMGLDGVNQITVTDQDGNFVENPNNYIDNYTFDSTEEAQAFIDSLLSKSVNEDATVEVPVEPEQTPKQYAKYNTIENDVIVEKVGIVLQEEGLITHMQAPNGDIIYQLTSKLKPANAEDFVPEVKGKYKIGDVVDYGRGLEDETFTITGVTMQAKQKTIHHKIKDANGEHKLNSLGDKMYKDEIVDLPEFGIFYTTKEGAIISEDGILRKTRLQKVEKTLVYKQEQKNRILTLERIAKRFQKLFPQIEYEIRDFGYEFDGPARFYRGVVQINTGYSDRTYTRNEIAFHEQNDPFNVPWLKRETVAHEFMHPFVLALKMSNNKLYNTLINELQTKHSDIINSVNSNDSYEQDVKLDEALTIYLGRELTKAFDKQGIIDEEYVASRPLLERFIDWLKDIVDFLTGTRKPKTLQQFIADANTDVNKHKEDLKTLIASLEELKPLYKKNDDKLERKVARIKKSIVDVKALLDPKVFTKLETAINNYEKPKSSGQFTFIERVNEKHYVEFDETNPNNVLVYIDPQVGEEYSLGNVLLQYADRIKDNDVIQKYKAHVTRNFYRDTKTTEKSKNKAINVKDINPLMRLEDVSNLLMNQLTNNAKIEIKYTNAELSAIDELEAYFNLHADKAKQVRKIIVGKLKQLKDTADVRLKSDTLKLNYNIINRLNLDKTADEDVDFVLEYIQQASVSVNAAWRNYNAIIADLKLKKGTFTKAELNRLNQELGVVRQLVSFYDEMRTYTQVEFDFKNAEDARAYANFQKSISFIDAIREGIQTVAINSTIEWFTPYMEQHNKYMKAEGYTDEKYLLTPKILYDHFKYGTGRDTNFITFWLGANITSRNAINATFANTLGDDLSYNNIDTNYDATTVNIGFNQFLSDTGISNASSAAQTKYYKDNYMRQAEVIERQYDPITDDYKDVYIKKYALHQEFLWDQYAKDLTAEKEKYKNPRNSAEQDLFDEQLTKWRMTKGELISVQDPKTKKYSLQNSGRLNNSYINKDYAKVKNDKFFKILEKHYNESNARYGENGLQFGIIPQKYDVNFLQKAKEFIADVKTKDTANDKFTTVKQHVRNSLAGVGEDTGENNLDGSAFKTINSNLTNPKKEEHLNLNLHETIVDFIVESRTYSTLKETQYNVETLMLLLEGNTKFGIPERKFASEDFTRKITSMNKLELARNELVKLDKAIKNNAAVDMVYYNKVKARVDKGIEKENVWDSFAPRLKRASTNYNNDMLIKQINDIYFGEGTEEVKIGNISANKLAHYVSLYTSINSMAGNVIAGVSNVNTGNLQLFIEGHGGKYFNKTDVVKASVDYAKNMTSYIKDLQRPIKSKDTQLSFLLDAIQGEIHDEFGQRVTGNIARKMFRINSLFLLTSLGEHQIQMTGMKAMLLGRKVKTKDGQTISLYDAFVADTNGRYALRTDIDFTKEDLAKFTRDLHGVNRNLNGNYSEFNKTMLQRKWYGNLAMKFRKYLYNSFRNRWASEHIDYERNTVETGYLRFFFGEYLMPNVWKLLKGDVTGAKKGLAVDNLLAHQKYARRKAIAEIIAYASITGTAMTFFGGSGDDDKKKLTTEEKTLLLFMLRLRSDIGTFSVDLPSEAVRQVKNPTASLNTIIALGNTLQQLWNPTEVYKTKSGSHSKGDSKLAVTARKLLPFSQLQDIFTGDFGTNVDNKLGYFSLINRNIDGVSPKQGQ